MNYEIMDFLLSLSKCKRKMNKFKEWNLLEILAITFLIVGAIIFAYFICNIYSYYNLKSGVLDMPGTGQVGDFVGGVVGAFWALASTLFFYNALQLQNIQLQDNQEQMRIQRIQFELDKITNIVFRHLEIYNQKLILTEFFEFVERDGPGTDLPRNGSFAIERFTFICDRFFEELGRSGTEDSFRIRIINQFLNNSKTIEYMDYMLNSFVLFGLVINIQVDRGLRKTDFQYMYFLIFTNFEVQKLLRFSNLVTRYYTYYIELLKNINEKDENIPIIQRNKDLVDTAIPLLNSVITGAA